MQTRANAVDLGREHGVEDLHQDPSFERDVFGLDDVIVKEILPGPPRHREDSLQRNGRCSR
jgi:hypothetical protein